MVKFDNEGQGYFDFLILRCSDEFVGNVKRSLENKEFESNEIFDLFNAGNLTVVYISHKTNHTQWFTILTEIKSPNSGFSPFISKEFLSIDSIDVIFKYLEAKKNE